MSMQGAVEEIQNRPEYPTEGEVRTSLVCEVRYIWFYSVSFTVGDHRCMA